jgi:hypothetical protein
MYNCTMNSKREPPPIHAVVALLPSYTTRIDNHMLDQDATCIGWWWRRSFVTCQCADFGTIFFIVGPCSCYVLMLIVSSPRSSNNNIWFICDDSQSSDDCGVHRKMCPALNFTLKHRKRRCSARASKHVRTSFQHVATCISTLYMPPLKIGRNEQILGGRFVRRNS